MIVQVWRRAMESKIGPVVVACDGPEIAAVVKKAGGEADYDLFYDEPSDTPYEAYQPESGDDESQEVVVVNANGKVANFAKISPLTQGLNRQLMFRRIHYKAEWKEVVRNVVDEVLKLALEREIEMAPIAGMLNAAEIVARSREEKVTH